MIMASPGRLYKVVRGLVRLRFKGYKVEQMKEFASPVVFICRHRNAIGPLSTLCLLPENIRPWAFSAFMDKNACREHLKNYTFPVTWHIHPLLSRVLSFMLGGIFADLVCSSDAIAVHRQSLKVRKTFQESVEAMENGDNLLIFPDINYAATKGDMGALHEGFLLLEQLWNRRTGKHVIFLPINVSVLNRKLTIGEPITFAGDIPFKEEAPVIAGRMEKIMDDMAHRLGE